MDEKDFALRLARLRGKKGISARDMSLSLGQNQSYINNIESCRAKPSLDGIFSICDFLNVSPSEFFDLESQNPTKLNSIIGDMKKLNDNQLQAIAVIVKEMIKNK